MYSANGCKRLAQRSMKQTDHNQIYDVSENGRSVPVGLGLGTILADRAHTALIRQQFG